MTIDIDAIAKQVAEDWAEARKDPKAPVDMVSSIKDGSFGKAYAITVDDVTVAEVAKPDIAIERDVTDGLAKPSTEERLAKLDAQVEAKAEATIRGEAVDHVDTELAPDEMVLELTPEQLRRILGVGACASKDKQRPILCTIYFEHRFNTETGQREFIFVATDSYTLAKLTFEKVDEYRWNPIGIPAGRMIPFTDLKAAANAAIKAAGTIRPLIKVTFGEKNVILETGGFSQTIRLTEGTFPAYEKLIGEKIYDIMGVAGALPALNPDVLKQLCVAFSPLASDRNYPMRMFLTSTKGTDLKPMGFTTTHGNTRLDTIIMPVRVNT